jgi:hypothetical protein
MTNRKNDPIRTLLQQALPAVGEDREPAHDLWPEMHRRLAQEHALPSDGPPAPRTAVPWFDWVLAAGVAAVVIAFPAAIPVLLYYL